MRTTHTFAELEVSREAYLEIYTLLAEAGYHHAFIDGAIDMKGIALTKGKEKASDQMGSMKEELERMVETGHIRIELCGHLECAPCVKGFTLDKRKYALRFEDETEDSVRVMIDPILTD